MFAVCVGQSPLIDARILFDACILDGSDNVTAFVALWFKWL
jgi:hypothetical protein